MSGTPGIDSIDLSDIVDTPAPDMVITAPPCAPPPLPPPPPPGIPPPSPPTPPPPPGTTEVKLSVLAVTSDGDDGNVSANTIDGDLNTRWSKLGLPAFIQLDLGTTKTVSYVKIAWYKGDTRTMGFNIQTSTNGTSFDTVFTGQSMGNTTALEMYNFPDVSARYVKINVTSNSQPTSQGNLYASITEIEAWGIGSGTETPPPPPGPPPPGLPPGSIDTDGVKIIYTIDTSPGKFHRNLKDMNISGNLSSSTNLSVDSDGAGARNTLGSLVYWAVPGREGSFASNGARNITTRLDWRSSTGGTQCGVSNAKSRGYIGQPNDTKNCEVTAIFRIRNVLNESTQHHHFSLKPRGDGHGGSNECTLQVGGRTPYTSNGRGRHSDLYSVEYTHPNYDMQNVTFVSPFTASNYPMVPQNQWFGLKFVVYNVNNNQTVHAEMWVDTNPINTAQNGFNNNWQKVWIFEHSGSRAPTWSGPNCQMRTNLAEILDVMVYNIHEIIPPTSTSTVMSAEELAEKTEYEENTGNRYPVWISQISETPINADPNTFVPEDELSAQQVQQEGDVITQSTDQFRQTHRIATTSDLATADDGSITISDSGQDAEEIKAPEFIKISTSEQTDAPLQYVKIRKLSLAQEPEPHELEEDDGDEFLEFAAPLPPPTLPDEEDPTLAPSLIQVTNSLTLKYNNTGRTTNSIIVKYNVTAAGLTRVTQSMIVKYNIVGRTTNSTIIKYNLVSPFADQFHDIDFDIGHFD